MNQNYGSMLIQQIADSTALASSTAQTTILHPDAVYTLPANFLKYAGADRLVIHASGRISTVVTTPGTLTFFLKVGSVNAFSSGALALVTTAQTNATWSLSLEFTARTIGASTSTVLMPGNCIWTTRAIVGSVAAASGGCSVMCLPDTAPAVGTGFSSIAAQTIDLQAQWSVNSASNSILTHSFALYAL